MKFIAFILVAVISESAYAQFEFYPDFFVGKYKLVGEALNSEKTYSGSVEFYLENEKMKVNRIINDSIITGSVEFISEQEGNSVLRISFLENDISYEQTCLWQSDLDNYARISCYLYEKESMTNDPGLEVLFYDHSSK